MRAERAYKKAATFTMDIQVDVMVDVGIDEIGKAVSEGAKSVRNECRRDRKLVEEEEEVILRLSRRCGARTTKTDLHRGDLQMTEDRTKCAARATKLEAHRAPL